MTIGGVFSLLLAIFKAIPALEKWFQDLSALYIASRIESMKQENREAIKKAIEAQDQRDLERAIGSPKAGEHSGLPGTEIRDSLPGVKP